MTETGMDDQGGKNDLPPGEAPREPLFNAPWTAVVLLGALASAFLLQIVVERAAPLFDLALSPDGLRAGRVWTLISYMFLHSGWTHFLMNGGSALAFAPPVARAFGERGRGPVLFFAFYLLCGLIAGLGFCLLHWQGSAPMVGASGAISGLWGAASRMLNREHVLVPVLSRPVLTQAAAFVVINVVFGFLGVFGGLNIAWEAHLIGYAAGLALIGPLLKLTADRGPITA